MIDDAAGLLLGIFYFENASEELRAARKRMRRKDAEAIAKAAERAVTAMVDGGGGSIS